MCIRDRFIAAFGAMPETQGYMRHFKIVAQVGVQGVQCRLKTRGGDHADGQSVHFRADLVVLLTELEQLAHLAFELPVLCLLYTSRCV